MFRRTAVAGSFVVWFVFVALGADEPPSAAQPAPEQVKEKDVAAQGAPQRQAHGGRRGSTIDDRVQAFAKSMNLDETQKAAVKKILEQRQQETLRIRLDTSISGSARIERFRALQDSTVERIRAVLNEEQRKNYDPQAPRKVQPAPDQRSVEDWIKATTPK